MASYTHEQLLPYFPNIDQSIKNKSWNEAKQLIEFLNSWERINKRFLYIELTPKFIPRAIPIAVPCKNHAELANCAARIVKNISEQNFEYLASDLQSIRITPLDGNPNQMWHLEIRLERKRTLMYCFGPRCFSSGKEYSRNELLSLKCCDFHSFCKKCLYDHISLKLGNNLYQSKIPCQACETTGVDSNKFITQEEIRKIIPSEIYNEYFSMEAVKTLLKTCKNYRGYCQYKDTYLQKEYLITFPCDYSVCRTCYALYLEEVIEFHVNMIVNAPQQVDSSGFRFTCPENHRTCPGQITIDKVRDLLPYSISNDHKKLVIKSMLEEHFEYFSGLVMTCCKNCSDLVPGSNDTSTDCRKCGHCILCANPSHPTITCQQYNNFANTYASVEGFQQIPTVVHHPDYKMFSRACEILRTICADRVKIINYSKITPSGMQTYKNFVLKELFPHSCEKYLLSYPFSNKNDADNSLYEDIPVDAISKLVKLPRKLVLSAEINVLILFKIDITGDIINRAASSKDKKEEPKMFMDHEFFYITNPDALIPVMEITTQPE